MGTKGSCRDERDLVCRDDHQDLYRPQQKPVGVSWVKKELFGKTVSEVYRGGTGQTAPASCVCMHVVSAAPC